MRVREKVALLLITTLIIGIARTRCMPRSLKKSSLRRHLNHFKKPNLTRVPQTGLRPSKTPYRVGSQNELKNMRAQRPIARVYDFPEVEYPLVGNRFGTFDFQMSEDVATQQNNNALIPPRSFRSKLINTLQKDAKKKGYKSTARFNNDVEQAEYVPKVSADTFRSKNVHTFPEVNYPQSAVETWVPNFWNFERSSPLREDTNYFYEKKSIPSKMNNINQSENLVRVQKSIKPNTAKTSTQINEQIPLLNNKETDVNAVNLTALRNTIKNDTTATKYEISQLSIKNDSVTSNNKEEMSKSPFWENDVKLLDVQTTLAEDNLITNLFNSNDYKTLTPKSDDEISSKYNEALGISTDCILKCTTALERTAKSDIFRATGTLTTNTPFCSDKIISTTPLTVEHPENSSITISKVSKALDEVADVNSSKPILDSLSERVKPQKPSKITKEKRKKNKSNAKGDMFKLKKCFDDSLDKGKNISQVPVLNTTTIASTSMQNLQTVEPITNPEHSRIMNFTTKTPYNYEVPTSMTIYISNVTTQTTEQFQDFQGTDSFTQDSNDLTVFTDAFYPSITKNKPSRSPNEKTAITNSTTTDISSAVTATVHYENIIPVNTVFTHQVNKSVHHVENTGNINNNGSNVLDSTSTEIISEPFYGLNVDNRRAAMLDYKNNTICDAVFTDLLNLTNLGFETTENTRNTQAIDLISTEYAFGQNIPIQNINNDYRRIIPKTESLTFSQDSNIFITTTEFNPKTLSTPSLNKALKKPKRKKKPKTTTSFSTLSIIPSAETATTGSKNNTYYAESSDVSSYVTPSQTQNNKSFRTKLTSPAILDSDKNTLTTKLYPESTNEESGVIKLLEIYLKSFDEKQDKDTTMTSPLPGFITESIFSSLNSNTLNSTAKPKVEYTTHYFEPEFLLSPEVTSFTYPISNYSFPLKEKKKKNIIIKNEIATPNYDNEIIDFILENLYKQNISAIIPDKMPFESNSPNDDILSSYEYFVTPVTVTETTATTSNDVFTFSKTDILNNVINIPSTTVVTESLYNLSEEELLPYSSLQMQETDIIFSPILPDTYYTSTNKGVSETGLQTMAYVPFTDSEQTIYDTLLPQVEDVQTTEDYMLTDKDLMTTSMSFFTLLESTSSPSTMTFTTLSPMAVIDDATSDISLSTAIFDEAQTTSSKSNYNLFSNSFLKALDIMLMKMQFD